MTDLAEAIEILANVVERVSITTIVWLGVLTALVAWLILDRRKK